MMKMKRTSRSSPFTGAVIGKSDMWSAGVVMYVLLVAWQQIDAEVGKTMEHPDRLG